MDKRLIGALNMAIEDKSKSVAYSKVAEVAYKAGYIVDPRLANEDVLEFLSEKAGNVNSTFYKSWNDIISKSRVELLIDQLLHYATTYGTEFSMGNGYVPNSNPLNIAWENFKFLKCATVAEIGDKISEMLYSGIALKNDLVQHMLDFVIENKYMLDVDRIANKEATAMYAAMSGNMPTDSFNLLRAIVYQLTGSTMLIKSREMIDSIKYSSKSFAWNMLKEKQLINLSKIFYRYKPLFLAMKNETNSWYINELRRLARTHHTPMVMGFWETLLAVEPTINEVRQHFNELNNFRLVRVMQAILERLNSKGLNVKMFTVRNGKTYIRSKYEQKTTVPYLVKLYDVCSKELSRRLKSKACKIYCPEWLKVTAPTTEKSFVGNLPMGSSIQLGEENTVLGIYWRNEWGVNDYDLHFFDKSGNHLGWNARFKSDEQDIIFSGDMTNADPEATELFLFRKGVEDGKIEIHKYYGNDSAKFRFFIAKEDIRSKFKSNDHWGDKCIMVDPNNIVFDTMVDHNRQGSLYLGYVEDGKLVLYSQDSNTRIPCGVNNADVQAALKAKSISFVDLIDVLQDAGFYFVTDEDRADADIDFTTVDKATLINLLS